jgi:cell division protein FtsL
MMKKKGRTNLIFLVIFLVVILAVTKIIVSNRLATFGQRLTQIDQEKIDQKKEKSLLEEKIYQSTSLESVLGRAQTLGFERAQQIVYYGQDVPVALR